MKLKEKINALEKSANEAYLNSINLSMCYSTNTRTKTRTSEAKRYVALTKELRRAKFALECEEIEEKLPDFEKMNMEEIIVWTDATSTMLHWFPCAIGDKETIILHEDGVYYLAVICYSEDGWIAEAKGVQITPHIVGILTSKGLNIVEN